MRLIKANPILKTSLVTLLVATLILTYSSPESMAFATDSENPSTPVTSTEESALVTPNNDINSAAPSNENTSADPSNENTSATPNNENTPADPSNEITSAAPNNEITSAGLNSDINSAAPNNDINSAALTTLAAPVQNEKLYSLISQVSDDSKLGHITPSTPAGIKAGETITVTVTPEEGYRLKQGFPKVTDAKKYHYVSKVYVGNETEYEVTFDSADVKFDVEFEQAEDSSYTLDLKWAGSGNPTMSPYKSAKPGTLVTVTATPSKGWKFDNISGQYEKGGSITFNSSNDLKTHTFITTAANATVLVTFQEVNATTPKGLTLTTEVINPEGGQIIKNDDKLDLTNLTEGEQVVLTVSPNPGYKLDPQKDAGGFPKYPLCSTNNVIGRNLKFTVQMPDENVTFTVKFIPIADPVTPTQPDDNTGGNPGGNTGGNPGGNTDNNPELPPATIEDEDAPLGDADSVSTELILPQEEADIAEDAVPLAALPKTGGLGSVGFMALGTLLAALGLGLKRKEL